ncbi:hypothetical protein BC830DRAFT_1126439 [Chytriomyces sp. MP71]|nr:hypothetical protein BC830DRAFT_1126439 [Chytriomyces sp. MP71]
MLSACFPTLTAALDWRSSRSIAIKTTPRHLMLILERVDRWQEWDEGLIQASLDDPAAGLVPGATGLLNLKQRGEFVFTVDQVDPERGYFSYVTVLKGATATWFWDFTGRAEVDGTKGIVLDTGVEFSGWAAGLYKWWIGGEANNEFQNVCDNLKRIAEQEEAEK